MNVRLVLTGVAMVGMMGAFAGTANAQIVTISDVRYKAPAGGNPATAEPKGTYSVPGAGTYQVVYDYGTVAAGAFTPTPAVSAGGSAGFLIARGGGNHNWTALVADNLNNPPMGLYCRARLQKEIAPNVWRDDAVAYAPCP